MLSNLLLGLLRELGQGKLNGVMLIGYGSWQSIFAIRPNCEPERIIPSSRMHSALERFDLGSPRCLDSMETVRQVICFAVEKHIHRWELISRQQPFAVFPNHLLGKSGADLRASIALYLQQLDRLYKDRAAT
jgi:hypothetical protein